MSHSVVRFRAVLRVGTFLIVALFGSGLTALASDAASNPEWIPSTEESIVIDGVVDEAAWDHVWSTELPVEVRPGENTPAPVRTQVLVTYSKTELYIPSGLSMTNPKPSGRISVTGIGRGTTTGCFRSCRSPELPRFFFSDATPKPAGREDPR